MMDKKLIEALEPIEDEFDVLLLTEEEVQEFLKLDLEMMEKIFEDEMMLASNYYPEDKIAVEHYVNGLRQGLQIARTYYNIRIDEGF